MAWPKPTTTAPASHLLAAGRSLSRRRFLKASMGWAALALSGPASLGLARTAAGPNGSEASSPIFTLTDQAPAARYWISTAMEGVSCTRCHDPADVGAGQTDYDHGQMYIRCELCALQCVIGEGKRGRCRTRINSGGRLLSLVYGRPVTVHVDPIEKKPFYHFLPGAEALSLATAGCPLSCRFCQNWQISQARPEDFSTGFVPPEAVVRAAAERTVPVIAYTYNEPTVFAEYLIDIARAARPLGISNVLISCGYANPRPLSDMCTVLDAVKIDLKGFSRRFYREVCGASLDPVLRSIREVAGKGVHLEIVNLVVPTLNDSDQMLADLCRWVAEEVGPDVPVHFTRFHPDYQMRNLPPTPVAALERAYDIAKDRGIRYPYVGNVPGHPGNHTYCPGCGKAVIRRTGFFVAETDLKDGACAFCGHPIAGVFRPPKGSS